MDLHGNFIDFLSRRERQSRIKAETGFLAEKKFVGKVIFLELKIDGDLCGNILKLALNLIFGKFAVPPGKPLYRIFNAEDGFL